MRVFRTATCVKVLILNTKLIRTYLERKKRMVFMKTTHHIVIPDYIQNITLQPLYDGPTASGDKKKLLNFNRKMFNDRFLEKNIKCIHQRSNYHRIGSLYIIFKTT